MSPEALVATELDSLPDIAPVIAERDSNGGEGGVESWLNDHINAIALTVAAAGFVIRIFVASESYLNPDEALHYLLLNQSSAFLAYKASLTNAHPPLIYLLLYFWRFLGRSELMLRLPSVFAGTALCWFTFKWIEGILGKTAGLIGIILTAFSPALIALSAEVREYALLLCFMAAALNFHERAFQEKSVRKMWYFSVCLYLAILTHYSAVFFALSIGIYSLARIAEAQLPRKVLVAWVTGQVGALAICAFLYVTHLSKIKNSIASWAMPFDQAYFRMDRESIFTFTWEHTSNIFQFIFQQQYVTHAMLLFFIVGVAVLFIKDLLARSGSATSSHLGTLLVLPFVTVWCAAIAAIYPYVGSRHTVFVAPFVIAGASFLLAAISRQRLWAGALIAILLVGMPKGSGNLTEAGITKENQRRTLMIAAMHDIHQSIPQGSIILVDFQSSFPISYYLCGPKAIVPVVTVGGEYRQFSCNGYLIVSLPVWKLIASQLPAQFGKMARTYGLKPGNRVWVFQNGWGANLDSGLLAEVPKFHCLAPKSFGTNLTIIPFVVGPDLLPATPSAHC